MRYVLLSSMEGKNADGRRRKGKSSVLSISAAFELKLLSTLLCFCSSFRLFHLHFHRAYACTNPLPFFPSPLPSSLRLYQLVSASVPASVPSISTSFELTLVSIRFRFRFRFRSLRLHFHQAYACINPLPFASVPDVAGEH